MTGRGAPGPWATPLPDGAFVGRAQLMDELTTAARAAARGTGCLVLLTGDAGMGKTSVVRALAAGVRDELAVSWGRCIADGGSPPFWPWSVLDELPSDVAAPDEWAAGAPRLERLNVLRAHVIERARRGPLLHVIEDLQWADVASVLLLGHLGTEVAGAPVMVVGTLRTGEPVAPALDAALEEVRRSARVRELPPLRDDEIATLIQEVQIGPDPGLTALVRDRTGGNPLYVTELLRAVRAEGSQDRLGEVVAGTVPSRVSEVVTHRLGRLPEAVVDVVATAAVVGTEGDAAALATVGGSTLEHVVELLEQARAARLLDAAPPGRWQFRHDLVRDAVYRSLADADRSRRHAAVLEALAAGGDAPPPVLAHHALAARPLFDADRATALAARAGQSAFAQHA
ncbi:MAG: AAA family ATPase, partial [Acidimicrobiales bacterium]